MVPVINSQNTNNNHMKTNVFFNDFDINIHVSQHQQGFYNETIY